jgi:hypothetical protein
MLNNIQYLSVKWTVSRGRDTYGYNIVTVRDEDGNAYRCNGGGYDMTGTSFGMWMEANYQDRLLSLPDETGVENLQRKYYGLRKITLDGKPKASLDGACGLSSMMTIADAIGLKVSRDYDRTDRKRKFETRGWYIEDTNVPRTLTTTSGKVFTRAYSLEDLDLEWKKDANWQVIFKIKNDDGVVRDYCRETQPREMYNPYTIMRWAEQKCLEHNLHGADIQLF